MPTALYPEGSMIHAKAVIENREDWDPDDYERGTFDNLDPGNIWLGDADDGWGYNESTTLVAERP